MKKLLPKSSNNTAGFTLVELLVVVSILAILAIIGLVIFGGLQKNGRDARRKADIDAIANAMEINYGKTTPGQYDSLDQSMFSSNAIPVDPVNKSTLATGASDGQCPTVCTYCYAEGNTAKSAAACQNGITPLTAGHPAGGSSTPYWVVCANLENPVGTFYCRSNQQ